MRLIYTVLWLLASSATVWADSFSIQPSGDILFNTTVSTAGRFTCGWLAKCSGDGTNALTLHSASGDLNLSFVGASSTTQIGNVAVPINLGTFTGLDSGYVSPTANPYVPIIHFSLLITHTSPEVGEAEMKWGLNSAMSRVGGGTYTYMPTGPMPSNFDYRSLTYSFQVFPLTLPTDGSSRDLVADVGAAPEPTTLVLIGSGLAGVWVRRRRLPS